MDLPVFVVTDTVPEEWVYQDSPFTVVTSGVEGAVEQARLFGGPFEPSGTYAEQWVGGLRKDLPPNRSGRLPTPPRRSPSSSGPAILPVTLRGPRTRLRDGYRGLEQSRPIDRPQLPGVRRKADVVAGEGFPVVL